MKNKKFLIIFVSIAIVLGLSAANKSIAGPADNVSGFAWSENIGWISFNNTSGGGAINYGVNIDPSTGNFSGYAWSENIGWIDFSSAVLDLSSFKVSGWLRALSNGGGWDGWIKLAKAADDSGANYQVSVDKSTGDFSGWAWGSDVVGWVNFKGLNYKVVTTLSSNQPPASPTFSSPVETWSSCSLAGVSKITLYWQYSDADGDPQDSYQVLVDNNPGFSSPEIDSCLSPEPNTCLSGNSSQSYTPITALNWNTTYYWKVKVKDNQGNWSNFSNSKSFATPSHAYPWIDFNWLPSSPKANELVQFSSASTTFYGGASGLSWAWDFGDSGIASTQNPTHSYLTQGTYLIKLGVCDNSSYCCTGTDGRQKSLQISLPLPEWKEISPF